MTFRERINVADFESQHFATQLVERLGWAVEDADRAERTPDGRKDEDRAARTAPTASERAGQTQAVEHGTAEDRERQPDERLSVPSPA